MRNNWNGYKRDTWFQLAKKKHYRSRAAFKLLEIYERFGIPQAKHNILDLGAAPGSWSQVAASIGCQVVAVDRNKMDLINGVKFLQINIDENNVKNIDQGFLFDGVISDIAPNTVGVPWLDHERSHILNELIVNNLFFLLKKNGYFCIKVFQGSNTKDFIIKLRQIFVSVKCFKPKSSLKTSCEIYIICQNKKE